MKVRELGEFGLIELLAEIVGRELGRDLVVGIGDDAAVWRARELFQIGTTDVLVQDVHFTLKTASWRDLGWKALAINISDIAAMGGSPEAALVSLGLPPETDVDDVAELYHGLTEIAAEYGAAIAGGNVSSAPLVFISVSLIGEAPDGFLTRSAALPGDQIVVTGYLGQAAAGLRMLSSGLEFDPDTAAFLREAHLRPCPRVAEGRVLVQHGVKAAIDLSDGLVSDLGHIAKASRVAAKVWLDRLPVHPAVEAAFKEEASRLALTGGEDYELLFTASGEVIDRVRRLMSTPVAVIGEMVDGEPGRVTVLDEHGGEIEHETWGWEHFKS